MYEIRYNYCGSVIRNSRNRDGDHEGTEDDVFESVLYAIHKKKMRRKMEINENLGNV